MERLLIAVESLLMCPRLDQGLDSALLTIGCLLPRDFPTKELQTLFERIMQKHQALMDKMESTRPTRAMDCCIYYSLVGSRTKRWLKQNIWNLLYECVHHNAVT